MMICPERRHVGVSIGSCVILAVLFVLLAGLALCAVIHWLGQVL